MDLDAFVVLLQRHHPQMRALAVRTMHDLTTADDALQNAYINAYLKRDSFRGEASFSTWLYRVVYRACLDELRRHKPTEVLDFGAAQIDRFEDVVGAKLQLHQALATLTPEHRAVVWLIDAEGYSYHETAAILAIAEGTVASRVVRAREAIRRAMGTGPTEVVQ